MRLYKLYLSSVLAIGFLGACSPNGFTKVAATATPVPVVNATLNQTNPNGTSVNGSNTSAGVSGAPALSTFNSIFGGGSSGSGLIPSSNSNCLLNAQPVYTQSSCACTLRPCDCGLVISQVRPLPHMHWDDAPRMDTSISTGSGHTENYDYEAHDSSHDTQACSTCGTPIYPTNSKGQPLAAPSVALAAPTTDPAQPQPTDAPADTSTATTNSDPTNPAGLGTSQPFQLAITDADARALYNRLAIQPVDSNVNNSPVTTRTGLNYACGMSNGGLNDSDYACKFDLSTSGEGAVLQQHPAGTTGTAVTSDNSTYKSASTDNGVVEIGLDGLSSGEGYVMISGDAANKIYASLTATETQGTEDQIQVTLKTGKQIKCYKSTDGSGTQSTTCKLKANVATGEIEALN